MPEPTAKLITHKHVLSWRGINIYASQDNGNTVFSYSDDVTGATSSCILEAGRNLDDDPEYTYILAVEALPCAVTEQMNDLAKRFPERFL